MAHSYTLPTAHADDLLLLIAKTPTGLGLLEKFVPFLDQRKVSIQDYPSDLRAELRNFIPVGHTIGACLAQDRILLDFEGARGVVAAYLVHEISCFLSLTLGSTLCREELEAEAIKKQLQFTAELRERDADYARFLKDYTPQAFRLNQLLEFEAA